MNGKLASKYKVGHVLMGNDGNLYNVILTKNNIKRWVKKFDDSENESESESKLIKKKSVKTKNYSNSQRENESESENESNSQSENESENESDSKVEIKKKLIKKKKSVKNKSYSESYSDSNGESDDSDSEIPFVSKFNLKTFKPMLAHKYNGENPIGYYASEKLDGQRAIYDGKSGTFISRTNKITNSPKFFTAKFPKNLVLDGELYTKKGNFSGTGIFRKKIPIDSEWKKATFQVFDLPLVRKPFEERYKLMKKLLKDIPYIKVVKQIKIKDSEHLDKIHNDLVSEGSEGTVIRKPGSFYENKRSKTLLKVKDVHDAEVIVDSMEFGNGRLSNVMGKLHVHWKNKKMGTNSFKIGGGFSDLERKNWKKLFPKGTIITIKYMLIDPISKKPREPRFMRIRPEE
jgi:DNA ligase-1